MINRSFQDKPSRFDRVTKNEYEDLTFDLINAFALVKNATDSALLLRDLLTKKEIQNLSKRLRIAKMLLSGVKQEEIVEELHCSFATVTKVKIWLDEGGEGLENVIRRLPKRLKQPSYQRSYPSPNLPKILATAIQELGHSKQKRRIDKFLESLEEKHLIDKQLKQALDEEFKSLYHKKKRQRFTKSTLQR